MNNRIEFSATNCIMQAYEKVESIYAPPVSLRFSGIQKSQAYVSEFN
jgi:hypothetical protein